MRVRTASRSAATMEEITVSKRILLVLVAAAATAGIAAPAGNAALSCSGASQPFAQFGDGDSYFGFSNNGFENGAAGWGLSGSSVGSGKEPGVGHRSAGS